MIEAVIFTQAQFHRAIIKHLGLARNFSVPHSHHWYGGNGEPPRARELNESNV
jgi:hypothetical protein